MILGKPKNLDEYICVDSKLSRMLHELGFVPEYREVYYDKIYYVKSTELENIVKEVME